MCVLNVCIIVYCIDTAKLINSRKEKELYYKITEKIIPKRLTFLRFETTDVYLIQK